MLSTTPLEDLRATTEKLVRIPSVSKDRETCHQVLQVIREMIPTNWETFHSEIFEHEGYQSLIIGTREGRAAPLILNGHVDVVTATPGQFTPEIRDDGLMWGRGTYDMKGSVAVYVELLRKVAQLPVEERPHFQVQFVSDEEIGGHRSPPSLMTSGDLLSKALTRWPRSPARPTVSQGRVGQGRGRVPSSEEAEGEVRASQLGPGPPRDTPTTVEVRRWR